MKAFLSADYVDSVIATPIIDIGPAKNTRVIDLYVGIFAKTTAKRTPVRFRVENKFRKDMTTLRILKLKLRNIILLVVSSMKVLNILLLYKIYFVRLFPTYCIHNNYYLYDTTGVKCILMPRQIKFKTLFWILIRFKTVSIG